MERQRPSNGELRKPLPRQKPLEFLPEREWIKGRVSKAEYEYVYFNNVIQYLTDQEKNPILDENGEQIARRQFNIEIMLNDFTLPNGDPRRAWIKLGASMGGKAHLPMFLKNLGYENIDPTPQDIIDFLKDIGVKFQMANKENQSNGNLYQQVIWDSVKPL
jgi:hypothetical protein